MVARLEDILDRETSSHTSFASFVDHYLRLPDLPSDVIEALENGDINLFEAEQFARVTAFRLEVSPSRAKRTRSDFLSSHLQTRASGERPVKGSMNCCVLHRLKQGKPSARWIPNWRI